MKHLKLYEDFDWSDEDFDFEEEGPQTREDLQFFIGDRVKQKVGAEYYHQSRDSIGTVIREPQEFYSRMWVKVKWDNDFNGTYEVKDLILIKGVNENFDWSEDDFDYEEEEPNEWVNLKNTELLTKENIKLLKGKSVMIDPDSAYYKDPSDKYNPRYMIGYITSIYYTNDVENHCVDVEWDNGELNVYRYFDLVVKI